MRPILIQWPVIFQAILDHAGCAHASLDSDVFIGQVLSASMGADNMEWVRGAEIRSNG